MLFKINQNTLEEIKKEDKDKNQQEFSEKKLEDLIITTSDEGFENNPIKKNDNFGILSEKIFGEQLFFIANQVATRKLKNNSSKYADIIAIDKKGNGVIIELKKDTARIGVDMQALQYVVLFSAYKGKDFLEAIYKDKNTYGDMENALMAFLHPINDKDINKKSRIILVASEFDDAVYAMGEWLDTQGIAFKCIDYETYRIKNDGYLSFSVAFDRSQDSLYRLEANKTINTDRDPAIFFHIVGGSKWEELIENQMIPCGFDGRLNDRGTQIMRNYVKDDKIIAYKSGKGILGYGVIEKPAFGNFDDTDDKNDHYEQKGGYQLFKENSPIGSPHTQKIKWQYYILDEKDAIKTSEFEKPFETYHPIQTSSRIWSKKANQLLKFIEEKSKTVS